MEDNQSKATKKLNFHFKHNTRTNTLQITEHNSQATKIMKQNQKHYFTWSTWFQLKKNIKLIQSQS